MPASLIHSFAILKEACAKANLHFNKITEKQCEAIVEICQRIENGQYLDPSSLYNVWQTGSGTQTNMNANEVISMLGNEYAKENILHPNDTVKRIPKVQMIRSRLRYISWWHKKSMLSYFHNWI